MSPAVDLTGKEIVQVGIVVRDAATTAKRYTELFGIGPWRFLDVSPVGVVLHDERVGDPDCALRVALAGLGRTQIELIQPLHGPSTHMEFLSERGQGVHHVSFGAVGDHDEFVSELGEAGVGIEMQGQLGNLTFTYLATQGPLGTIFEVVKGLSSGAPSRVRPWGTYAPSGPGTIDIKGKEIVQIGIVVEDVAKTAARYEELLGIGPFQFVSFKPPLVRGGTLHGISMGEAEIHIEGALANHGHMQLELLEPVSGPSTHMEFLKTRGQGVHHVSFGAVDDHDEVVAALESQGIDVEMTGRIGADTTFTYMASQADLGTIFEVVKTGG
ncbi:MAG: VOC family protein [Myxococcota bacterium]